MTFPHDFSIESGGFLGQLCKPINKRKTSLLIQCTNVKKNLPNFQMIFKYQEEVLQEILVLRLIQIFDKLWIEKGLDLKILTLKSAQVDDMVGYFQVYEGGESFKNICEKYGTGIGSGDRNPVMKYLESHNKGKAKQASLDYFKRSLAGYCVASYVLGIFEKQYSFYMITENGRFFCKNFGDQIFGGQKREKPLVFFTKEMELALELENKSQGLTYFYNLCYSAISILRKNAHQILNLIAMMKVVNMPCFCTDGAIEFVKDQLNLVGNDADACQNVDLCH